MPPFVGMTDILGTVIIAMSEAVAVLYVLGAIALLAVAVPWLATMEQPTPRTGRDGLGNQKWGWVR